MTARLDSWIRDFADKVPFSSNLAESPMPAVVETRVMKCLQKKKIASGSAFRSVLLVSGEVSHFGGGSEE